MFDTIKRLYIENNCDKNIAIRAVKKGYISALEYEKITGEEYII